MAVCVTGHRNIVPANLTGSPWPDQNPVVLAHHRQVKGLMAHWIAEQNLRMGETEFISGMALGADQLFAETILELQNIGYPIHLIAAVPFEGQESRWTPNSQAHWKNLMSRASFVQYVCEPGYAAWKMQKRNEWMVNHSNRVLAVWNGAQKGGTWNCLSYAQKQGRQIMVLNPVIPTLVA